MVKFLARTGLFFIYVTTLVIYWIIFSSDCMDLLWNNDFNVVFYSIWIFYFILAISL